MYALQFICVSFLLQDNRFIFKKNCGPRAYRSLALGYGLGPGPETYGQGRSGSGPNINGLGRAWA